MPARLYRLLVLFAALALVQLGGLSHGISHHAHDADAPHAACELCGAYGVFDHGLSGCPPVLPVPVPHAARAAPPLADAPLAGGSPYQSRAPPVLV